MRRRREALADVPRHLLTFHAEDWQGSTAERWRAWHDARKDHFAASPGAWSDLVALMVESYAVRRSLLPDVYRRQR